MDGGTFRGELGSGAQLEYNGVQSPCSPLKGTAFRWERGSDTAGIAAPLDGVHPPYSTQNTSNEVTGNCGEECFSARAGQRRSVGIWDSPAHSRQHQSWHTVLCDGSDHLGLPAPLAVFAHPRYVFLVQSAWGGQLKRSHRRLRKHRVLCEWTTRNVSTLRRCCICVGRSARQRYMYIVICSFECCRHAQFHGNDLDHKTLTGTFRWLSHRKTILPVEMGQWCLVHGRIPRAGIWKLQIETWKPLVTFRQTRSPVRGGWRKGSSTQGLTHALCTSPFEWRLLPRTQLHAPPCTICHSTTVVVTGMTGGLPPPHLLPPHQISPKRCPSIPVTTSPTTYCNQRSPAARTRAGPDHRGHIQRSLL